MRILYIDIDSLRPDHLGCYGYHRNTSPNIDQVAAEGVRFENVYVTDAPCLPSRTALWSGRFGFHTGVINHGGTASQPFIQKDRSVFGVFGRTSWMSALRQIGYKTATISPFGERHTAWHWYAGFNEVYNSGRHGLERADEITPIATDWIARNGADDNWFLHVNLWDPHTPYRTPAEFGDPFADDPLPAWLTEEVRQAAWNGYGPHSPQEVDGFEPRLEQTYPRAPTQLDSMEKVKQWIDGYDTGIRYADDYVGKILDALAAQGVLDDTVIMISADHGENQGELNVWGDHQTADQITCRVPLIIKWPGVTDAGRVDSALHYHFDWAATLLELAGAEVPSNWDGVSFAEQFRAGEEAGQQYLVISQGAWSCQRGVRFTENGQDYLCIQTYHDGYKGYPPIMLFNLTEDPHEQHNLAVAQPERVQRALAMLATWHYDMMATSTEDVDPMMTVLREGGPIYTRDELPAYLERLRATGRAHHADALAAKHPEEADV